MSRRVLFLTALSLVLVVPSPVGAQVEPTAAPLAAGDPAPPLQVAETTGASAAVNEVAPLAWPQPSAANVASIVPPPRIDFKVGDWQLRKVRWRDLRLNNGRPIPLETIGPQDAKGIPTRPLGGGGRMVYNPTVLAQQGMKRLDSYKLTGSKVHLRQARKLADKLTQLSEGGKRRRWQPHRYDLGVHDRGWVNSNSHGLTLSFLTRYYRLTGAEKRLRQAQRLLRAFEQRPKNKRWISLVTNGGYIWFEHWPDGTNDHTLNAHINALFGLYDYWLATGDPMAELYFLGGAKTVRDKLYRFRRKGLLSRYSLADTDGTLHYHETHIDQLRTLAKITGDKWFARQADRFEQDEEAWKDKFRRGGR